MKLCYVLPFALVASGAAFAPAIQQQRTFGVRPLRMSDEGGEGGVVPGSAREYTESPAGKLVAIKEDTVEFTAGILGGLAGFAVGGPLLGAIGAAAANYVSKSDNEAADAVTAVSKTSIQVYNYLATLDDKYTLLDKAKTALESALEKLKANQSDPASIEKVESALKTTKEKITEVNDEYDLVGAGVTALGVIGDLVEKAVAKAGELNEEYKLTDKAMDSLNASVSKAKDAAVKSSESA